MSEALAELLVQRRRFFINIAGKYAPPGIDPEDCVQDAAVLALRFSADFRGENIGNWFGTIVRNCALYKRRYEKKRHSESMEEPFADGLVLADKVADCKPLADEIALRHQILELIKKLPQDSYVAMHLAYVEDLPYQEIADKLHIPLGTLKARLARARTMIRKRLTWTYSKA